MMTRKIILTALIVCSVFAVNFSVGAAETEADAEAIHVRKGGGFDRTRPNNFTLAMKKLGRYLLFYIPNRLADACDIISLDFSVGGDFAIEFQVTRYFQFGGSYGQNYFMTKGYSRQFGFGHKDVNHFGFGFMEKNVTFVDETTGNVKEYVIDFPQFLTADYHLDAFRDNDVDFWAIGGKVGWVLGVGFGIHPVEIADFITGICWYDLSGDDF